MTKFGVVTHMGAYIAPSPHIVLYTDSYLSIHFSNNTQEKITNAFLLYTATFLRIFFGLVDQNCTHLLCWYLTFKLKKSD